jgi:hypothetical protein
MKRDSSESCLEGEFCCISTDCLNSLWYNENFFGGVVNVEVDCLLHIIGMSLIIPVQ